MLEELEERLAGLRVALGGFAPEQAAELTSVLSDAGGFCKVLPLEQPLRNPRALHPFDLAVMDSAALGEDTLRDAAAQKPILLVGERQQLLTRVVGLEPGTIDFLIQPWQAEDLLLRCLRLHMLGESHATHDHSAPATEESSPLVIAADDDATTRVIVTAVLKNSGLSCKAVEDGQQALAAASELHPKAMVLDINMPKLDGFEVLAALRREPATARLPVVLLTARQQEADVLRGFALGASDYVVKPFNPMELAARLKRLLRSW